MKLRYETAIATFIQFITLTFLNVITATVSVVSGCTNHSNSCVTNALSSVVFFLLVVFWFGTIWLLGLYAQQKRSKRLAKLLIAAELMVAVVALFNMRHHVDWLGFTTSLIDFVLAIWVITLAYHLIKAGNGRVVKRQTARKKRQLNNYPPQL